LRFRNLNEDQIIEYTDVYLSKILNSQRKDRKNLLVLEGTKSDVFSDEEGLYSEIDVLGIPRHPTQLFEAFGYWIIFITLALLYLKTSVGEKRGFMLGVFLILLFGFRFFIEYFKEIQVSFEQTMSLNMGQWLSVPLVSIGILLVVNSKKEKV
jgi:phosphatidylglycerol:prolipoprotein diacylglycerol transferase